MKRIFRKIIQHQVPGQQGRDQKPFFSASSHEPHDSSAPFFQKQVKEGDKDEGSQTLQRSPAEEENKQVSAKEAEDDRKEQVPVMRKESAPDEKDKQPKAR